MSLQWRVATALAAVAAAATITVGMISYRATDGRLMEEVDRSLVQALGTIEATTALVARSDGVPAVYIIQTFGTSGDVRRSTINPALAASAGIEKVLAQPGERNFETIERPDGDLRVLNFGASSGAIQVGRPLSENAAVLDDLRQRTIWVVALVTVAAAMVGWLIALTVTAPLKRLTRAATDVQRSGRLDVDVPVAGRDEVGQLGTAFNGMLGALATSRAEQQRLVEDAGHELRTPLTSVRTNLAVLRRHPDLDVQTRRRVLDDLEAETEQLVELVEEIVALAHGSIHDEPAERIELGELAREIAIRAERRHGRPVVVTADESIVEAPPPALERAISNLVDNAAKFDRTGGPIEVVVADGGVVVHDRGPGIAPGDHHRVFDRFYRSEAARSFSGSGLGLSIVRDLAERNGGTVMIADRPGGGASVGFKLGANGG